MEEDAKRGVKTFLRKKLKKELIKIASNLKIVEFENLNKEKLINKIIENSDSNDLRKLLSKKNNFNKYFRKIKNHPLPWIISFLMGTVFAIYVWIDSSKDVYSLKTEVLDSLNKEKTKIKTELDSIKSKMEMIEYLQKANHEYAEYLNKKYPDGYVLFGLFEDSFIYNPKSKSTTMQINADWEDTEFKIDWKSRTMKIFIPNVRMNNKKGIDLEIGGGIGQENIPILPRRQEIPLRAVLIGGEINMFLELLDKINNIQPIYVVGFRKYTKAELLKERKLP